MYGFGYSEEFIGDFMRETGARPQIATKYAPLPWRFTSGSVVDACRCGCDLSVLPHTSDFNPTHVTHAEATENLVSFAIGNHVNAVDALAPCDRGGMF